MPSSGAQVTVVGRLTQDPAFKEAENGNGIQMRLNIAQNWRSWKGEECVAFYSAMTWLKKETYDSWAYNMFMGSKGKIVTVAGELRPTESTSQSGQKMQLYINNAVVYPSWKNESAGQPYQAQQPAQPQQQQQGPVHTFAPPAQPQQQMPAPPVPQQPQQQVAVPPAPPVQQQQPPAPPVNNAPLPPAPPTPGGLGGVFPPPPGG